MNYKYNPRHMNPSSLKSRFATRFLRALTKIHAQKPISPSSPTEIFRRYRKIKDAADKSMAYSVRSRRIWSRAILWNLRRRSCARRSVKITRTLIKSQQAVMKKTRHEKQNNNTATTGGDGVDVGVEVSELRELVPGGEAMDLCNLLDETAHYIKCLTTQVQAMKKIADFYSL